MSKAVIAEQTTIPRQKVEHKSIYKEVAKDLFAGSMGGVAQVLTGQPFDIVKVRMQNQSISNPMYKVRFNQ
jgi:solute carrier family 25 (mitochondrial carnitine/acylcarnitine transporter), member 20/29